VIAAYFSQYQLPALPVRCAFNQRLHVRLQTGVPCNEIPKKLRVVSIPDVKRCIRRQVTFVPARETFRVRQRRIPLFQQGDVGAETGVLMAQDPINVTGMVPANVPE
jgi:hypothetical protein